MEGQGPARIALSDRELREVTAYATACAQRVLPVYEERHPDDVRPREAVEAAGAFAAGGPRTAELRRRGFAAFRAAAEVATPAAADAARAAGHAAGAAFLHPLASAHQVRHVLGAAAHAARAAELASGDRADAIATLDWALAHAPAGVAAVLGRLPAAPSGGGGVVGEYLRRLDAALRAP